MPRDAGYSPIEVERLLGLHETTQGEPDRTILDLLSIARDPGGDQTWADLRRHDADAWTAQRGPLAPDSELACVLWDFLRAMKELPLLKQAIVALTVMGFSPTEIASLIDPARVIDLGDIRYSNRSRDQRLLDSRRKRVSRAIDGRPKRDAEGNDLKDEHGEVIYTDGIAQALARKMSRPHG